MELMSFFDFYIPIFLMLISWFPLFLLSGSILFTITYFMWGWWNETKA
jgi:hypothetical protein